MEKDEYMDHELRIRALMTRDEFIEHEIRIRMLETLSKSMNHKLNALITIALTGFAMPMLLKYFGV